jgi:hypothetical protein
MNHTSYSRKEMYLINIPIHCVWTVLCQSTIANMTAMGNFEVTSGSFNVSFYRMCSKVTRVLHATKTIIILMHMHKYKSVRQEGTFNVLFAAPCYVLLSKCISSKTFLPSGSTNSKFVAICYFSCAWYEKPVCPFLSLLANWSPSPTN